MLPPYISVKTFLNLIQKLNESTVPEVVDSGVLRSFPGSTARQLKVALRYLRLTDAADRATPLLERLVAAYGTEQWGERLSEVITPAYHQLVGTMNLSQGTRQQLEDRFRSAGAHGNVLNLCVPFWINAVTETGRAVSPHILQPQRGRPRSKRQKTVKTRVEGDDPGETDPMPIDGTVKFTFPVPGKESATIQVPADLEETDWHVIDAMMRAYVSRKTPRPTG